MLLQVHRTDAVQQKSLNMTLYIKNLHPKISEKKLGKIFKKFGNVSSIVLALETKFGTTSSYGYVEMENSLHAMNAILSLDGSKQKSLVISVSPATVLKNSKLVS